MQYGRSAYSHDRAEIVLNGSVWIVRVVYVWLVWLILYQAMHYDQIAKTWLVVVWVRCGTRLYRFLIFVAFLSLFYVDSSMLL